MDVLEAIRTRRSIRKFADIPIPMQQIGPILEAGRAAPSAGNLQTSKFIIITDLDQRKQVADACLQQFWIATAPVIIVIAAEIEKNKEYYGHRGETMYAVQNASCAAQNMMLCAHATGLSSCFVSAFDDGMLSRITGLPDGCTPQVVLPIGFADEKPPVPPRYNLEILTFFGRYGRRTLDMNWVLGHYSVYVEDALKKGKEFLDEMAKKLK